MEASCRAFKRVMVPEFSTAIHICIIFKSCSVFFFIYLKPSTGKIVYVHLNRVLKRRCIRAEERRSREANLTCSMHLYKFYVTVAQLNHFLCYACSIMKKYQKELLINAFDYYNEGTLRSIFCYL